MDRITALLAAAATLLLATVGGAAADAPKPAPGKAATVMQITSPASPHQGEIPRKHTCEDRDVSPALAWSGLPDGTKSLALIVDDPDAPDPKAPKMTWVHWILYNLPPDSTGLPEAVAEKALPAGTLGGTSDYRRSTWGGPCPPIGRHRYFFKLYALDLVLPDLQKPNKAKLLAALEGHILARAELVGTYQKQK